jgi:predicted nicotinamide N-methyase
VSRRRTPGISECIPFILAATEIQSPPHTPELKLHLASEIEPVWRMTEAELDEIGLPPPFWAFAWAGGQALARYLLDHPAEVAGRRVLDFAAGGGIVGVAAMLAGAGSVLASDIDPFAAAATELNAKANGVRVAFASEDLLARPAPDVEVIVAGDVWYEKPLAERVTPWLRDAHARGVRVLIGDPGRSYFPKAGLTRLADYSVATTRELEDREVKRTGVWTFSV